MLSMYKIVYIEHISDENIKATTRHHQMSTQLCQQALLYIAECWEVL